MLINVWFFLLVPDGKIDGSPPISPTRSDPSPPLHYPRPHLPSPRARARELKEGPPNVTVVHPSAASHPLFPPYMYPHGVAAVAGLYPHLHPGMLHGQGLPGLSWPPAPPAHPAVSSAGLSSAERADVLSQSLWYQQYIAALNHHAMLAVSNSLDRSSGPGAILSTSSMRGGQRYMPYSLPASSPLSVANLISSTSSSSSSTSPPVTASTHAQASPPRTSPLQPSPRRLSPQAPTATGSPTATSVSSQLHNIERMVHGLDHHRPKDHTKDYSPRPKVHEKLKIESLVASPSK
jgi:hypothetical protein